MLVAWAATSCSNDDSWIDEQSSAEWTPDSTGINPMSRYLVVVGDIQVYTMTPDFMNYFMASMEWLRMQQSFFNNIDLVVQVGDITDSNLGWQWGYAMLAMRPVAEAMPMIAVTGNHDYTWLRESGDRFTFITSRESTLLNEYKLPVNRAMAIVSSFEPGKRDNVIYRVNLGGRMSHIIALEFGPRPEVVEWARRHIASNPLVDCYLVTHEWLSPRNEMVTWNKSYALKQFGSEALATGPDQIWERIVKPYDNVITVLCGHNNFVRYIELTNDAGRPVPQMLFNLQYQDNGGDSMLQLWEFPQESDSVYTYVYNTMQRLHHPDPATRITFSRSRAAARQ